MAVKLERNFESFLTTYHEYAQDGFTPPEFHFWSGVSILAGAMERKCYLPFNNGYRVYPNMYVLLVADPGIGKSAAGRKAVTDLLMILDDVNCVPSQNSEAKLIELLSLKQKFFLHGSEQTQCAGYLFASEASNCLKEINGGGDLKPLFTDFYDCPTNWEKATMKQGKLSLKNVCFNLLAGCTFEYLKKLVPESEIRGGFASRVIYVLHDALDVRSPTWLSKEDDEKVDQKTRSALLSDLRKIHQLSGEFTWNKAFNESFMRDFAEFEAERIDNTDNNSKSLLARRHLNILKLCMVLSASEGDSLALEPRHWEAARGMLAAVEQKYSKVLTVSGSGGMETQNNLNQSIQDALRVNPRINLCAMKSHLVMLGNDPGRVNNTINIMVAGGVLRVNPQRLLTFHPPTSLDADN